jgi:subtilisin family serine protease
VSAAETPQLRVKHYGGDREIAENLAFSFDAGDSYAAVNGRRSFKRIAGLVAIALESGVTPEQVIAANDALPEYTLKFKTVEEFTVFGAPKPLRQQDLRDPAQAAGRLAALRKMRHFVSVNPVFMDPENGRWVILAQRLIVKLKPGIDSRAYFRGAEVRPLPGTTDQFILSMPRASAEELFQEVDRHAGNPAVDWAEPDIIGQMVKHVVPNDTLFAQQWTLDNTGQGRGAPDADVDAAEAWNVTTGSPNVVIAIMDEAVEVSHPDLFFNMAQNPIEVPNGVDDDNNGYVDDVRGWDFVSNDNNPSPVAADQGHGTACAGVAGAVGDNGFGVSGIAQHCAILPIRMFGVAASTLAQSIYYAAGRSSDGLRRWRGADVISMSLGVPQSAAADTAFNWAAANGRGGRGCAIFVASGNSAARWQNVGLGGIPPGLHTYEWEFAKDGSTSQGLDTAWLDGVSFPDGSIESFEGTSLPAGWTTSGNANWFSVQNNVSGNHALAGWNGQTARAVRAGNIGDGQRSILRVTKSSQSEGEIVFRLWVSAELGYDGVNFLVDGRFYFAIDDDPSVTADPGLDYPARHTNIIAVGASTDFDFRADYSCYSGKLDFVAPSDGGYSGVWTVDVSGPWGYDGGDYISRFGGTSAACPLAAGVAGLVLSANTNLSAQNIRRLMQATCDKIGNVTYSSNTNLFYGRGRINAAAAVSNAVLRVTSIQTNATTVVLRFASVLGWTYNLERASGLDGPWGAIQSNLAGTGNVIQLADTAVTTAGMRRYYRVRLLP